MAYYVWAQWYWPAPVFTTVRSDEICYGKKHVHGLQPTPAQVEAVIADLRARVEKIAASRTPALSFPTGFQPDVRTRSD